jgi:hypothetical protein
MDYVISSDPSWVDIDVVWRFLSEESYWARGIPRETVLKSLPHSFFLVFTKSARRQLALSQTAVAIVLPSHRTHGSDRA